MRAAIVAAILVALVTVTTATRSIDQPARCNPLSYPYVNQTYHCQSDCRTYTLVDVNAGCMPNWAGARAYCESRGLELAPWNTDASKGALYKLCRDNRYTCWTGGRDDSTDLCPLMTQEGYIVQQACEQPVRFVCRTTAVCMLSWRAAADFCNWKGGELVPYGETSAALGALRRLCHDRRYTCWTGDRVDHSGQCPLMTAEGEVVQQGCDQAVRWVCRTKVADCILIPELTAPNVALALANIPFTRTYFFLERAYGAGEGLSVAPNTGVLDLDSGFKTNFNANKNPGCSGVIITPDGVLHLFGGDVGSGERSLGDGRQYIAKYNAATTSVSQVTLMQKNRWYPTPLVLSDGKVLIVGGSDACLVGPTWDFAELWDPAQPTAPTASVTMPPAFVATMGLNWYPFMALMPKGEIVWFVEKGGAVTDKNFNVLVNLPPFPAGITYCTMFYTTASVSLIAVAPPAYGIGFVIFGGTDCNADINTVAATTSLRISITYCNTHPSGICVSDWEVEDMLGVARVMGDSTLLPNGKILLHGGAQMGHANAGPAATKANFQSLMYDPYKPAGQRYSKMDFAPIARVYHSANCLDVTGKVLVAGCENCDPAYSQLAPGMSPSPKAPLEYRLEWGVPAEIAPGSVRPVIGALPADLPRGASIAVPYTYAGSIQAVTLAAACATTHSINMNQRVFTVQSSGVLLVSAPPAGLFGKSLLGPHILFLVGEGGTYSEGKWITVTDV
eukprot:XP_001701523.1 glyoxal or galactose oxidase [Chlamydomonas reinhardtii]